MPYTIIFTPFGPLPSCTFDCDDAALLMYNHFRKLGFEVIPVIGNLELEGEEPEKCDHTWVMVQMGNNKVIKHDWLVPYDWKTYFGEMKVFDAQHYEYYPINYEMLLKAVKADLLVGKWQHGLLQCPSGIDSKYCERIKDLPENKLYYLEFLKNGNIIRTEDSQILNGTWGFTLDNELEIILGITWETEVREVYQVRFSGDMMSLLGPGKCEATFVRLD